MHKNSHLDESYLRCKSNKVCSCELVFNCLPNIVFVSALNNFSVIADLSNIDMTELLLSGKCEAIQTNLVIRRSCSQQNVSLLV